MGGDSRKVTEDPAACCGLAADERRSARRLPGASGGDGSTGMLDRAEYPEGTPSTVMRKRALSDGSSKQGKAWRA